MLVHAGEEVCLEARRHGIVLARPLLWASLLAAVGGVLLTLPWFLPVAGLIAVAAGAGIALRAVWKWERTRVVVTPERVLLLDGTWRRRARAVRLGAVEAVELQQSLGGRLFGYGTVVVGTLALDHVPRPKRLYGLLEQLGA